MRVRLALGILSALAFGAGDAAAQGSVPNGAELRARMALLFPGCVLEEVPAADLFLAVAADAATPTNLQFGPHGGAKLMTVDVEAGDQPITLLLDLTGDTIVEFRGAVDRVRKVVATWSAGGAPGSGIGVVGLEASRVSFFLSPDCQGVIRMLRDAIVGREPSVSKRWMTTMFGRELDRREHVDTIVGISLPSFSKLPSPGRNANRLTVIEGGQSGIWRRVIERDEQGRPRERLEFEGRPEPSQDVFRGPAGDLKRLAIGDVVASRALEEPETLPGRAGLAQLEQSGGLRRPTLQEALEARDTLSEPYRSHLSPHFRFRATPDYVVTRDLALPSGPPDRLIYLVPEGLPVRRGPRRGACFLLPRGAAEPPDSSECFGDAAEAMRKLHELPAADPACRLLAPGDQASVHAISVYQPASPQRRSGRSPRTAWPIDVNIEQPGRVFLVLSSYEPTSWRLLAGPGTQIVGVLVLGYYASTVEGLEANVPVRAMSYDQRITYDSFPASCAAFLAWNGTAYEGGPAAMALDRQVQALAGRTIDTLQGGYTGSRYDVR